MDKDKMIIDFHVLQTVPPSNINRDDTGSPKTAIYGGVQRARVSSQSWKRAMREMFRDNVDESKLGLRTKRIVEIVSNEIQAKDSTLSSDDSFKKANDIIVDAGVKTKDMEAQALFFISMTQAKALAEVALSDYDDEKARKKAAKNALNRKENSIDIALFGRMVADDPGLNADASAQVAHAISVHKVDNEYDFFTAVDDVKDRSGEAEDAGAGMLGTVEYNSSTLYRYATVFVNLLNDELAGDAAVTGEAVREFARAFITSMPTGKLNTFANRTLPSAVLVTIRKDQPINLVGAFEEAVGSEKITWNSSKKLAKYASNVYDSFAAAPEKSFVIAPGDVADEFKGIGEVVNLDRLLEQLESEVAKRLGA
ncbi:MAG: type I-E CRISPR-associated protein Cas7/Cse4/CasC [Clostridiales Family XIII bacterium]|jgi:CRISPR system Cascade subunit CasC|nr:type I-E CRISPR-associated protein Cas7/Cse4/CasC [Clostridiales Family XIII bacterium]